MPQDYYETLGVKRDANDQEIKKAFRKAAQEHHPDKGGDEKKFKEANQAYQVLSDEQKRAQYDQFGSTFDGAAGQPGGGAGGFSGAQGYGGFGGFGGQQGFNVNMDDIDLGDIFGSIFGGGRRQQASGPQPGNDAQISINLTFNEAVFGAEKEIELYKREKCDKCNGNGAEPGTKISDCEKCAGKGKVRQTRQTPLGAFAQVTICPECRGEGKKYEKPCEKCGGDGRVKENKKIKIKIPAGIANGQTIEIEGRGEAGTKGGGYGDLYVTVQVAEHDKFERDGYDIIYRLPISFAQAALGDTIEVDTIRDKEKLKIPAGTQSGKVLRLHNQGVPVINTDRIGDMLIETVVVTPKKLTKRAKELYQELAKEQGQNVDAGDDKSFWSKVFE